VPSVGDAARFRGGVAASMIRERRNANPLQTRAASAAGCFFAAAWCAGHTLTLDYCRQTVGANLDRSRPPQWPRPFIHFRGSTVVDVFSFEGRQTPMAS
jgi:hypothetical protein